SSKTSNPVTIKQLGDCITEALAEALCLKKSTRCPLKGGSDIRRQMPGRTLHQRKLRPSPTPSTTSYFCLTCEGCQKCGVFCVLASICDQLKNEHEVDVCRCVERARTSRPEFITNAQNIATQLTRDACALSREADEELRRQSREERPG
ncbi:hypothetical protein V5799_013882, partial [Amblyomma americanum]